MCWQGRAILEGLGGGGGLLSGSVWIRMGIHIIDLDVACESRSMVLLRRMRRKQSSSLRLRNEIL